MYRCAKSKTYPMGVPALMLPASLSAGRRQCPSPNTTRCSISVSTLRPGPISSAAPAKALPSRPRPAPARPEPTASGLDPDTSCHIWQAANPTSSASSSTVCITMLASRGGWPPLGHPRWPGVFHVVTFPAPPSSGIFPCPSATIKYLLLLFAPPVGRPLSLCLSPRPCLNTILVDCCLLVSTPISPL